MYPKNAYAIPGIKADPRTTDDEKVENIKAAICTDFGFPWEKIQSKNRLQDLVLARHLFMYLVRMNTKWSLKRVGLYLTPINKDPYDHTTVIAGVRRVTDGLSPKTAEDKVISYYNSIKSRLLW